jgi:hypothetical protein
MQAGYATHPESKPEEIGNLNLMRKGLLLVCIQNCKKLMTITDLPKAAATASGILAFVVLFKPFFGKKKDFWECVIYSLTPNFLSWLDNDLQRDYGKSMKLGFFILLCVIAGFLGYTAVDVIIAPQ